MAILARPRSVRFIQMLRMAVLLFVAFAAVLFLRSSYRGIEVYVVDIPLIALGIAYILSWVWLRQSTRPDGSLEVDPLYLQILLDVFLMGLVVFYSGASTSTLLLGFLLPIVLASAFLYLRGSLLAAGLSTLLLITLFYLDMRGLLAVYGDRYYQSAVSFDDIAAFDLLTRFIAAPFVLFAAAFMSAYIAENLRLVLGEVGELTRRLDKIRLNTSDVLANLESGLITVDEEGFIIFFNRAAREILHIEGPEPEGRSYATVLSGRLDALARLIEGALEGTRPGRRNELWIDLPDGRRIPLGVTPSILWGEEGIRGAVLIFQDITEAKLIEEKIRRQDRLAAVGELAAGIAHELRNPLASISGSAEVLTQSLDAAGEDAQLLNLVVHESSRVNQIVEEFLNYARIQQSEPRSIELRKIANDVVTLARNHPSFKEHSNVAVDLDACPPVLADEGQMKQVLLNLVLNGLEAMEQGGTVRISCPPEGERLPRGDGLVEVWVQDDGPGILPEEIDHIFEPFHTAKRGGTGLGLAVVQRIVESHDGQIIYAPSSDGKCTFRLYLPKGEQGA